VLHERVLPPSPGWLFGTSTSSCHRRHGNSDTCFFALLHQDVWFYRPSILPISPLYFHIFHIFVFYLNSTICRAYICGACVAFPDCAAPARERQGQIKINLRRGRCTEDVIAIGKIEYEFHMEFSAIANLNSARVYVHAYTLDLLVVTTSFLPLARIYILLL
jgi:hypothetical protein